MTIRLLKTCLLLFLLAGCNPAIPPAATGTAAESPTSLSQTASPTPSPQVKTPESTQPAKSTPAAALTQPTTTTPTAQVCSPLHGFQLAQLADIVTTRFDPPAPGGEGGHHGVDFAFYTYGAFATMEDLPVQSILDGKVAAATGDRPPYGYTVIIETPLASLPSAWMDIVDSLPPPDEYRPDRRLACPTPLASPPESGELSLYILYAHLAESPSVEVGDQIGCGEQFGLVGNSGFSGNTHLHLEFRLGPAGVQFLHLAHYINNATAEEMQNYCLWRVSPQFRLIDPLVFLLTEP